MSIGMARADGEGAMSVRNGRRAGAVVVLLAALLALCAFTAGAASAHPYYLSLSFVDRQHGYAAGIDNHTLSFTVWKTTDGGDHWRTSTSRVLAGSPMVFVDFVNASVGVWSDMGRAQYTTDGGGAWHDTSGVDGFLTDVSAVTTTQAWGSSTFGSSWSGGSVMQSTDGGKSWIKKYDKPGDDGVGGFSRVSSPVLDEAYALWTGPSDGKPTTTEYASVVYGTEDDGTTWQSGSLPAISGQFKAYHDISFSRPECGWAVGDDGAVAVTTDGVTWKAQSSGVKVDLNAVQFVDGALGYAVGDHGTVLKTTNGGDRWVKLKVRTNSQLEALSFVDATHGWIAGAGGTLLRTGNGGKTWLKAN